MMKITAHAANGIYYFIDIIELLAIFEILPKEKSAAIKKIRVYIYIIFTHIKIYTYRVWTITVMNMYAYIHT